MALIVTSLLLAMLSSATLASVRRIEFSSNKNRALLLARSKLEAFSAQQDSGVGLIKGREGDLSWEIAVSNAGTANAADESAAGVRLRQLRIRVMDDASTAPLVEVSAQRLFIAQ